MQEQWEKGFAGCVENKVAFLTAKQGYSKAFAAVASGHQQHLQDVLHLCFTPYGPQPPPSTGAMADDG